MKTKIKTRELCLIINTLIFGVFRGGLVRVEKEKNKMFTARKKSGGNYKGGNVMKDDLSILKRILKSCEHYTDDEQIERATGGIEQAIDDLTLLPVPQGLPEPHEKITFAEFNLAVGDIENTTAIKPVIMPMRLAKSWIALYAEQVENPRCFVIWGLNYAIEQIASSNLNEKRKNAISDVLRMITAGLKVETGDAEKTL